MFNGSKENILLMSFFISTVLFMGTFQPFDYLRDAYSQQQPEQVTVLTDSSDVFLDIDFVYGFIGALAALIPIVIGLAYYLKKSVNSATTEFIKRQTDALEQSKRDVKEHMKDYQSNICNQLTTVNNNVNEKFNASKESIIDMKKIIDNIDEKLDESRTSNTENRMRLNDVERRVSMLESNRSSHNPMGKMGLG